MIRLSSAAPLALTLALAVACGEDKKVGSSPADAGSADVGVGGTSGDSSTGGAQDAAIHDSGPPDSGAGGRQPDAQVARDTTPPAFNGATGVAVDATLGEGKIRVSWAAATDDRTPASSIGYRVYRASSKGGEDFTAKRHCGDPVSDAGPFAQAALPCFVTAGAGSTSAIVRDVIPEKQFYFVVRAFDEAGNQDTNTSEVHGKTTDATSPEFGGVRSVTAASATSINVTWGAVYDFASAESQLTFDVFVTAGTGPFPTTPTFASTGGDHSTMITGLLPRTDYSVQVHAVDPSGNVDANQRVLGVTTPEGIPPTFDGARQAIAEGKQVHVFWLPGSDDTTESSNLLYDVYQSMTPGGEDLTTPSYTSDPGAASITIDEPNGGTRYYFVVRARDTAGNRSALPIPPLRPKEVVVTTGGIPDNTAPTFSGVRTVQSSTPTSLDVSWLTAQDAVTGAADFTYLVYVSAGSTVATDAPAVPAITLRGLTATTLTGLKAGTEYTVAVVAQDLSGNVSAVSPMTATTLAADPTDTTPPVFGLAPVVSNVKPDEVTATWSAATDVSSVDGGPTSPIRYLVCVSPNQADCKGASFGGHVAFATAFGVTTARLRSLTPRTLYYVFVRAEDAAGNVETLDHLVSVVTQTSWSKNVFQILLNRCVACHSYDKPAQIVNVGGGYQEDQACTSRSIPVPADGCLLKLIDPGYPQYSLIYRRINPLGLQTGAFSKATPNIYVNLQEPRDTPTHRLTAEEDQSIQDWIRQGALGN